MISLIYLLKDLRRSVHLIEYRQYLTDFQLFTAYYMGQWKKGFRHGYGIKMSANAAKLHRNPHRGNFSQPSVFQSHLRKGNGAQFQQPSLRASPLLQKSCGGSFENYDTDRSLSPNPQLKRAYFSSQLRSDQSRSRESKSAGSRSDSNDISDVMDNDFSPGRLCSYPRKSPVGQDSVRTEMTSHSSGFGTMSESSSTNSLNLGINSSTPEEIYKGESDQLPLLLRDRLIHLLLDTVIFILGMLEF